MIKDIAVIAKLENGDYHQIFIKKDWYEVILNTIALCSQDKKIQLNESPVRGVKF